MNDQEKTDRNFFWAAIIGFGALILLCLASLNGTIRESHSQMQKSVLEFCDGDGTVVVMDVIVSPTEDRVLQRPRAVVIVENNKGERACWPFLIPTTFILPDPGGRYKPVLHLRYSWPLLIELERVPLVPTWQGGKEC